VSSRTGHPFVFEAGRCTRHTQPRRRNKRPPKPASVRRGTPRLVAPSPWVGGVPEGDRGGAVKMFQQHRTRVEEVLYEKVATVWTWLEVYGWLALAVLIVIALAWPYVLAGYSRMRSKANAPSEFRMLRFFLSPRPKTHPRCLVTVLVGRGVMRGAIPREDAGGRGRTRGDAGRGASVMGAWARGTRAGGAGEENRLKAEEGLVCTRRSWHVLRHTH